ncbi:neutral alpha-glucosidase AB-like isoform X2 [Dendronephthya gigantea]|uniref:neutral alpha-glucosidase AB-like isoform X2 n=1 Tax=Dendronephthya gigantea TaxID=151771 RepID=UPI00106BA703|nr:neutral alpha-glucosidase AB-like isoform X2 [Dendronephthya gigantea]
MTDFHIFVRFRSVVCVLILIVCSSLAIDMSKFKKCEDSSFCKRNQAIPLGQSPYSVVPGSIKFSDSAIDVQIINSKTNVVLSLQVIVLQHNTVRFKINEINPIHPRYEVQDVLVKQPSHSSYEKVKETDDQVHVKFNNNGLIITMRPLRLDFLIDNQIAVSVNSKGLMNFEHYQARKASSEKKDEEPEKSSEEDENNEEEPKDEEENAEEDSKEDEPKEEEEQSWEESFHEHKDSRPKGPSSVGLDISFLGFDNVYGIPEHADSLALKSTMGKEPYRLFNLDVFEYDLNNGMALYGSIPYMLAHSVNKTVGVFWLNAAETWIDISTEDAKKNMLDSLMSYFSAEENSQQIDTHWMSESGIIDVFVMLGPKPHDVFQQYAALTGPATLPPMFAIAYHQCRWNYNDQDDVISVDANFDKHDIPYDVLWLDIEHTDGKRYMTWDTHKFPNPEEMQNKLAAKGRRMVTIVDPHIKRDDDYHIHREASSKGYYVKNKDGGDYEGWCWPGSSSWIDFFNPEVRDWWASKFALDQYKGSTPTLSVWNDMNEMSVFNGPEITMHKDAVHYGGWENRDVHNLYGFYNQMSTYNGLKRRSSDKERPFVLSRAFFAGTQRYGAIWTGDNIAEWSHLKMSLPMMLTLGVTGMQFSGADVGGFFQNPDGELLVRWYQTGAYLPFFRAHAHLDTKRREPWLFEDKYKNLMREAIRHRYALLPFWYTLFHEASQSGSPVVAPLWVEYPEDKTTFTMEDQYLLGRDLLIKPVTTQGQATLDVYLPDKDQLWYDLPGNKFHLGGQTIHVATPLNMIPVFQRGGSIIPRKERIRRCSSLMTDDPYTLAVALNKKGEAEGKLYMDDGISFDYQKGKYEYREITFKRGKLESKTLDPSAHYETKSWLERIVILGMSQNPSQIVVTDKDGSKKRQLEHEHDPASYRLTIKKPAVNMAEDWNIVLYA